jgi:precorrin-6B C5,15-methyltransferase / cobalt-precorrin-6B C5,C15-methyltransferase
VPERVAVVGVYGGLAGAGSKDAARAVEDAELVVGAARHLEAVAPTARRRMPLTGDLAPVLDAVAAEPGRVCVLASGDPGFFGIVRALAERLGPEALEVHPAPSSVAIAFARLGLPWDDATVVSAHGRPLPAAARRAVGASKAAVLTSPDARPEELGRELSALGARHRRLVVCTRLGEGDEAIVETDVAGLVAGRWDPLAVVVLLDADAAVAPAPVLAWGLDDADFAHRQGMLTKAEVRAVALGKLALPPTGVLWDVGAGSGSVAVECARLTPGLRVLAVERDAADAARIAANAAAHHVTVEVVEGEAPVCLDGLPPPDRAFVGGGGLEALDAVLARLAPGGRVVATYAALDRAAAAAERLGSLVQVAVSRGLTLPDGGVRLAAENPVFVTWGPE